MAGAIPLTSPRTKTKKGTLKGLPSTHQKILQLEDFGDNCVRFNMRCIHPPTHPCICLPLCPPMSPPMPPPMSPYVPRIDGEISREIPTLRLAAPAAIISKCTLKDTKIDTHLLYLDTSGNRNVCNGSTYLTWLDSYSTFKYDAIPTRDASTKESSRKALYAAFENFIADSLSEFENSERIVFSKSGGKSLPHPPFVSFSSSSSSGSSKTFESLIDDILQYGVVITIGKQHTM